jgi:PPIC-type PPIASE domain
MMSPPAPRRRDFGRRTLLRWFAPGSQRLLALSGLAALLGLGVAGMTLLSRTPPAGQVVPPGYVALVNGKGILMSDFVSQVQTVDKVGFEAATAEQRSNVLRDMINEELLVQRALVLDLPETTTEVRDEMVMAVNAQVAQPALAETVSDQQLRAYYEAHKTAFTSGGSMSVTDLVLHVGGYENADQSTAQAQTDATEAAYQLRSGADRRYIIDHFGFVYSGKADGSEQMDFAAKLHLGNRLYEIARTMIDGQVSDPIAEDDGVHLLIMDRRVPDDVADFDSVRSAVYTNYRDEQSRRAAAQHLEALRREARIVLAPGEHE